MRAWAAVGVGAFGLYWLAAAWLTAAFPGPQTVTGVFLTGLGLILGLLFLLGEGLRLAKHGGLGWWLRHLFVPAVAFIVVLGYLTDVVLAAFGQLDAGEAVLYLAVIALAVVLGGTVLLVRRALLRQTFPDRLQANLRETLRLGLAVLLVPAVVLGGPPALSGVSLMLGATREPLTLTPRMSTCGGPAEGFPSAADKEVARYYLEAMRRSQPRPAEGIRFVVYGSLELWAELPEHAYGIYFDVPPGVRLHCLGIVGHGSAPVRPRDVLKTIVLANKDFPSRPTGLTVEYFWTPASAGDQPPHFYRAEQPACVLWERLVPVGRDVVVPQCTP